MVVLTLCLFWSTPARRCDVSSRKNCSPFFSFSVGFAHASVSVTAGAKEETKKTNKIVDEKDKMTLNQILLKAGKRGVGGGIPGAIGGLVQGKKQLC
jgi:hypothetical protein